MNISKSVVAGIIGCVAGAAIAGIAIWAWMQDELPVGLDGSSTSESGKPLPPIKRSTIEDTTGAITRLPELKTNRTSKGRFIVSGRGEDANWGLAREANFQYTADVIADSKILEKKSLPGGNLKVVELRTFRNVTDSIVASEVDLKIRLDTLPIKTISYAIDVAAGLWGALTGDVSGAIAVKTTKDLAERELQKVDGKGIRELMGFVGLDMGDVGAQVEEKMNELAGRHVVNALGNIRKVSGKSYLITYYQAADSQPLTVTFKNEDGSDIIDEEEQLVLRRVNAFLDYCLVPDKKCRPGDTWNVHADEFQELFDPFVDGDYIGTLKLTRESNNELGDWVVSVAPCEIRIVSAGRKTTGSLQLAGGRAEVDPNKITLKTMAVNGDAELTRLTKHHMLFTSRLSGACAFEGRLFIEPETEK